MLWFDCCKAEEEVGWVCLIRYRYDSAKKCVCSWGGYLL